MNTKLLLIADPLCGWCFGADPLLSASRQIPDLSIELHCGGLFSGDNSRPVDASMRQFILDHHERILQLSGQDVGEAFIRLIDSGEAMLDSTPPIRGILAAGQAAGDPLDYYQALIGAHFKDGRKVTSNETLQAIASECGINSDNFLQAFNALDETAVKAHIFETRRLMQQVSSRGFPTFVLQVGEQMEIVDHHEHYHNPAAWQAMLIQRLAARQEQSVL